MSHKPLAYPVITQSCKLGIQLLPSLFFFSSLLTKPEPTNSVADTMCEKATLP